ncbi:hypothetical protein NQ315_001407 [Exocentrus adspersus]|uniref:Uncharacterized protein n=1 Tax=Exocentrus adspersus TaxID=1586481 RepID=A0AAV8WG63_9CUCU|nr:hypothetical protein NQ315_001407 [Exocentrus adspersus]
MKVVLVFVALGALSKQECFPDPVCGLAIKVGGNLTWSLNQTESCTIDEFQVDIVGDKQDQYHFKVNTTFTTLSFLEVCEK